MKNNGCKKGFTLIELLVVVLIIGILAAIAMPQYQKAVWKSRGAELMTQAKALYNAQQTYFMEHGHFADSIDLLPIDFNSLTRNTALAQSYGLEDGYVKGDGDVFVYIHPEWDEGNGRDHGSSGAVFGKGPYAMCGFAIHNQGGSHCGGVPLPDGELLCLENTPETTGFCTKLFKGTLYGDCGDHRHYKIP